MRGQLRVDRWLKNKASKTILDLNLIQDFHKQFFCDVFPQFAGRLRGPAPRYIPRSDIRFGPYYGLTHDDVPDKCIELSDVAGRFVRELDVMRLPWATDPFAEEVLRAASWVHCELVRIHPFLDGNGRTARTCINYFAWRYEKLPIPFERSKELYVEATNAWLDHKRIEPLMDFLRPLLRHMPSYTDSW